MKKYIFLTLLFLIPFIIQADEFKIDETKSDIYFVNSVLTTRIEARANLLLISDNIKAEQYKSRTI